MCWGMVKGEGRVVQRCSTKHGLMLKETWEHDLLGQAGRSGFLHP